MQSFPNAELERELIAQGRLIEAGWQGLRRSAVPANAPAVQLEEMRTAFFAGAQHMFSSVLRVLDPGDEPTEADLTRMDKIDAELRQFIREYELKHGLVKGRG